MNFKEPSYNFSTVADPGCLSRIRVVYRRPVCLSQIPDLGSRIQQQRSKRRRGKNRLFYSNQIQKNFTLFYFWTCIEKKWANWQRIVVIFTQKIVTKLSGIRDPKLKKSYPGSRGGKGTGSRIRIRNTEFFTTNHHRMTRVLNVHLHISGVVVVDVQKGKLVLLLGLLDRLLGPRHLVL